MSIKSGISLHTNIDGPHNHTPPPPHRYTAERKVVEGKKLSPKSYLGKGHTKVDLIKNRVKWGLGR